jgi:phage-related protein
VITLDGIPIKELGLALLKDHQNPGLPGTTDYTVQIPGMHGAHDYGADLDVRPFEIPLGVKERGSRQELALAIRNIMPVFVDSRGHPKTMKVVYDYEPDVFLWARYSGAMTTERLKRMGKVIFPLVAFKPLKHFVESTEKLDWNSDAPIFSDVPIDAQYVYNVQAPQTLRVYNFGSLIAKPIIEIQGSAGSLNLTLNGINYSFNSFSGLLLLDADEAVVLKDGVNFLDGLTGKIENFELDLGANDVAVSGTNLNIKITFKFHAKYL